MTMRFNVVIATTLTLLCIGFTSGVSEGAVSPESTESSMLRQHLARIESLTGQFEQTIFEYDEQVEQLTGDFALQRPNLLYWKTKAPEESVLVADGETVWYFNPFIDQVSIFSQIDAMAANPLLVLLNDSDWSQFSISRLALNAESMAADIKEEWVITGHEDGQQLKLSFNAAEELIAMTLTDTFGQRSEFRLLNTRMNTAIPAARFVFEIPDGVDIDDQRNVN